MDCQGRQTRKKAFGEPHKYLDLWDYNLYIPFVELSSENKPPDTETKVIILPGSPPNTD
jgi:hypothetical protein